MKWILCKDRLPPKENLEWLGWSCPVLICLKNGEVCDYTYYFDYEKQDSINNQTYPWYDEASPVWSSFESSGEYANEYCFDEVYAWMPLPESPKELLS